MWYIYIYVIDFRMLNERLNDFVGESKRELKFLEQKVLESNLQS